MACSISISGKGHEPQGLNWGTYSLAARHTSLLFLIEKQTEVMGKKKSGDLVLVCDGTKPAM